MAKDKIGPILFFCIVFPVIYMVISLLLSDEAGWDTVNQLNYGLIIGVLIWIALKE